MLQHLTIVQIIACLPCTRAKADFPEHKELIALLERAYKQSLETSGRARAAQETVQEQKSAVIARQQSSSSMYAERKAEAAAQAKAQYLKWRKGTC